tara:strand:- start:2475 stop:3710 length:1236 start_codon:yes stop_codon:yes gene_type:complete
MLIIYRILINLIILVSPFIIIYRLIKKKEDLKRFKEKFCFFSKSKKKGKLIWFHGASVGELLSIVPILEKLDKDNKVQQILVTSNTLSSSKIINKFKFKKIIHQFYPIDSNFLTNQFLNHWSPSSVFFIDSEIWPNMINNLNKNNIPITLLNARITKKTFKKWIFLKNFSKKIFGKINLCLASSHETKNYLKKLGAKNIKFIGNIKFSQSENGISEISEKLKKFLNSKKTWCASSTHFSEEQFCGHVHKKLKLKYENLLTIIIPRHIDRVDKIKDDLKKLGLKIHLHEPEKKIQKDTDIYIVNAFGKTKSFYKICKNVFLGGSLVNHGGQNPLEATRYGCNILHGPNIHNFKEIYKLLKKINISNEIKDKDRMIKVLEQLFIKKANSKNKQIKLKLIGKKILDKTYKEIIL